VQFRSLRTRTNGFVRKPIRGSPGREDDSVGTALCAKQNVQVFQAAAGRPRPLAQMANTEKTMLGATGRDHADVLLAGVPGTVWLPSLL